MLEEVGIAQCFCADETAFEVRVDDACALRGLEACVGFLLDVGTARVEILYGLSFCG